MEELVYFYPDGHEKHIEQGHPERPERVEVIRDALKAGNLWDSYQKLGPVDVPDEILQFIHSPAYLNLLELTCKRSGHLDMDTYTTEASWELAHRGRRSCCSNIVNLGEEGTTWFRIGASARAPCYPRSGNGILPVE